MGVDYFSFRGYGILRVEEKLKDVIKTDLNSDELFELLDDGAYDYEQMNKEMAQIVKLDSGMRDMHESENDAPGCVLYIPDSSISLLNLDETKMKEYIYETITTILNTFGFVLEENVNLKQFIEKYAHEFESEGAFY